ncbi:hypothetical protein BC828DRAFT_391455 [Blastocladiella britannica]|nr:hypothetical protein BC828DRAFT_391455 [Blastocladiella britannica]
MRLGHYATLWPATPRSSFVLAFAAPPISTTPTTTILLPLVSPITRQPLLATRRRHGTARFIHSTRPLSTTSNTRGSFAITVHSMREATDPHMRMLVRLAHPSLPLVAETRAAEALVARAASVPRYLGLPTPPHSAVQLSGWHGPALARAVELVAEYGYLDRVQEEDGDDGEGPEEEAGSSGIVWNAAWPMHVAAATHSRRGRALGNLHVGAPGVDGLVAGARALSDALAIAAATGAGVSVCGDPPRVVLPLLATPSDPSAGPFTHWPSIATAASDLVHDARIRHLVLEPPPPFPITPDSGAAALELAAEVKASLPPGVRVDVSYARADRVPWSLVRAARDIYGLDGVVLGEAVARDVGVVVDLDARLAGGASDADLVRLLGTDEHRQEWADDLAMRYAQYADAVRHHYAHPYPIRELLAPLLAGLYRGADRRSFAHHLNHAVAECSIYRHAFRNSDSGGGGLVVALVADALDGVRADRDGRRRGAIRRRQLTSGSSTTPLSVL